LYRVPHLLTHDLCEKRKEYAKAMLPFLHVAERDSWHHLVTGDESCFLLDKSSHRMWILPKGDVVTKPRIDIQSKRFMFTIMWNPSSFYVVDRLTNDIKMNGGYFVTNIFIPFEHAIFPRGRVLH
jgi:hypothetical protein